MAQRKTYTSYVGANADTIRLLEQIRAELQEDIRAVERLLTRERSQRLQLRRVERVLRTPEASDLQRRAPLAKRKPHSTKRRAHERTARAATATFLEQFSTTEPRQPAKPRRGIGVLVLNGYLRHEGDGFLRTDKPFVVERP